MSVLIVQNSTDCVVSCPNWIIRFTASAAATDANDLDQARARGGGSRRDGPRLRRRSTADTSGAHVRPAAQQRGKRQRPAPRTDCGDGWRSTCLRMLRR